MFANLKRIIEEQLGKISARERVLVAGFIVSFAAYLALTVFDASEQSAATAAQSLNQLASARAEAANPNRVFPEARFKEQIAAARKLAFQAQTIPIARVQAQTTVERLATEAGVMHARAQPEGEPSGDGELRLQEFTLRGGFDWASFLGLLRSVAKLQQSIGVRSIAVDAGPSPTINLRLRVILVEAAEGQTP